MVDYLTNFILNRIKVPVLELFLNNSLETLKSAIERDVLINVLFVDLNLVGGIGMETELSSDWVVSNDIDKGEIIIEIPADKRRNSTITTATLIYENYNDTSSYTTDLDGVEINGGSTGPELLTGITNANSNIGLHTEIEVIGSKFILIRQKDLNITTLNDASLKFEIAYCENMEGIDRAYFPEFGRIAVLAAKFLLHNKTFDVEYRFAHNPVMSTLVLEELKKFEGFDALYDEEMDLLGKMSHLNNDNKETDIINLST